MKSIQKKSRSSSLKLLGPENGRKPILCFADPASRYNRVKKNQLDVQLILSIFRQPLYVSGISKSIIRSIIRRYNRMYTTIFLLLLQLALQPTVGFGLSNKILQYFPICHQLSPSSLNPSDFFLCSTFVKISFFTVWGC
jgi:hypothetical protein